MQVRFGVNLQLKEGVPMPTGVESLFVQLDDVPHVRKYIEKGRVAGYRVVIGQTMQGLPIEIYIPPEHVAYFKIVPELVMPTNVSSPTGFQVESVT